MNKWRTLTGTLVLLSLLERSSCSVNVGANLGISGLFNPSTQYHYVRQSYPYYMDEYQYRNMDSSYLEGGQEEENEHDIDILDEIYELNEIDRQVGSPDLVDDGGQLFGDLTPLLLTSALVVGLSAVFNNVVSLNSTASNTSVPFGLWALPELPVFPNLTLPGRKRRSLREENLENFLDDDYEDLGFEMKLNEVLGELNGEEIAENFKNAIQTMALMENTQCQAALGCRYGRMFVGREDRRDIITYILPLLRPLKWTVFTEVFERVSTSKEDQNPIDCNSFYCQECLRLQL